MDGIENARHDRSRTGQPVPARLRGERLIARFGIDLSRRTGLFFPPRFFSEFFRLCGSDEFPAPSGRITGNRFKMRVLLIALAVWAVLIFAAGHFADAPVARFVHTLPWSSDIRLPALGLPVLVTLSGIAIVVGAVQVETGHALRNLVEILVIASFSLTSSVCIDELILKRLFGRETPDEFLNSGIDAFRWLQGTSQNSFPSGHAAQIVSVGIVFLMTYPKQRPAWLALMGIGLTCLVLGNWHFVSDVIAGAGVGAIGGTATTLLWRRKSERTA